MDTDKLRTALAAAFARRHQLSPLAQTYLRAWAMDACRTLRAAAWPDLNNQPGNYYVSAMDYGQRALVSGPYPSHRIAKAHQWRASQVLAKHDPKAAFYAFGTASMRPGQQPLPAALQKLGYDLGLNKNNEQPLAA